MPAEEVLELLLVLRAIQNKPVCPWITKSVAEDDVQSKTYLIDEVVHIAIQAAIIVTREDNSLAAIEEYPARKLNSRHPSQASAIKEVPSGVIDDPKHKRDRR